MRMGLIGRKVGMTRVFNEEGTSVPVSIIEITPNRVSQIKDEYYKAVQLTGGFKKAGRVSKPLTGHFKKANIESGDHIAEFRMEDVSNFSLGQTITINEVFKVNQFVDVSGLSKGKGFAGTVKRHNFRTQDASHGNSRSHRVPGSIGQNQTPGKVFKGKKMAGQMGNKLSTVQNLQIVELDVSRNLLLLKGAIPGHPGSKIKVRLAVKKQVES